MGGREGERGGVVVKERTAPATAVATITITTEFHERETPSLVNAACLYKYDRRPHTLARDKMREFVQEVGGGRKERGNKKRREDTVRRVQDA